MKLNFKKCKFLIDKILFNKPEVKIDFLAAIKTAVDSVKSQRNSVTDNQNFDLILRLAMKKINAKINATIKKRQKIIKYN